MSVYARLATKLRNARMFPSKAKPDPRIADQQQVSLVLLGRSSSLANRRKPSQPYLTFRNRPNDLAPEWNLAKRPWRFSIPHVARRSRTCLLSCTHKRSPTFAFLPSAKKERLSWVLRVFWCQPHASLLLDARRVAAREFAAWGKRGARVHICRGSCVR